MNEKFKPLVIITMALVLFVSCKHEEKEIVDHDNSAVVKSHLADTIPSATTTRNWLRPPYKHWSIKNVDKLFPVGTIAKGAKIAELEKGMNDLTGLKIEQFDGKMYGFEEHLDSNRTDGFLVLHQGKIIYEKYFKNMLETTRHNWFSVSKSLTGTTAAMLAVKAKLICKNQYWRIFLN